MFATGCKKNRRSGSFSGQFLHDFPANKIVVSVLPGQRLEVIAWNRKAAAQSFGADEVAGDDGLPEYRIPASRGNGDDVLGAELIIFHGFPLTQSKACPGCSRASDPALRPLGRNRIENGWFPLPPARIVSQYRARFEEGPHSDF